MADSDATLFHSIRLTPGGPAPSTDWGVGSAIRAQAASDSRELPTHVFWMREPIALDRDGRSLAGSVASAAAASAQDGISLSNGIGRLAGEPSVSLRLFDAGAGALDAAAAALQAAHPTAIAMSFATPAGFDLDAAVRARVMAEGMRRDILTPSPPSENAPPKSL